MPIGVIINSLSVFLGGLIGAMVGKKLNSGFVNQMNNIMGCCSIGMGISNIVLMQHMPAVVFSVILGTGIGLAIHLGDRINSAGLLMQKGISRFIKTSSASSDADFQALLVTCITLFCASGTGIYGSIIAGMSGDHSILLTKAILDLCTAVIFACSLGAVTAMVAVPQFVIFLLLFLIGGPLYHGLDLGNNAYILNNFKGCGGFIMLATGMRICKVKAFPVADMIPSMIVVIPVAIFWNNVIVPFIASLV